MTEAERQGPTATSDVLAGSEWRIVRLADTPLVDSDAPLVVSFGHDGRVFGSTGVNELTASYSVTADYVTFGPLATTRRAATPEQMAQEHVVVSSFAGMCPFRLTAHTLSIDGPLGRVELVTTTPLPAPAVEPDDARSEPER